MHIFGKSIISGNQIIISACFCTRVLISAHADTRESYQIMANYFGKYCSQQWKIPIHEWLLKYLSRGIRYNSLTEEGYFYLDKNELLHYMHEMYQSLWYDPALVSLRKRFSYPCLPKVDTWKKVTSTYIIPLIMQHIRCCENENEINQFKTDKFCLFKLFKRHWSFNATHLCALAVAQKATEIQHFLPIGY